MDYYGLMHFSPRLLAAPVLTLSLIAGTVHAQVFGPASPSAAVIEAHGAHPPLESAAQSARLDAELFYEIFLGELMLQVGDPGTGYALMMEAARRSNDEQLYKRAADIALQSRSGDAALAAARAWEQAHRDSHNAQRYLLQTLLALNRTADTGPGLRRFLETAEPTSRKQLVLAIPLFYRKVSDKTLALTLVREALDDYQASPALAPAAAISIGRMQLLAGEPGQALASARKAAALDPSSDDIALLALDLLDAKVPGSESLAKSVFSGPREPQLRMGYARTLLELQRNSDAQEQLEIVTEVHPEFSQAWLALAALQLQSGAAQAAEVSLSRYEQQARTTTGTSEERTAAAQIYLLRSEIAEKRGNFPEALDWLDRIDNAAARFDVQARRAVLLARSGNLTHARALVQSLASGTPEAESRKKALDVQVMRAAGAYADALTLHSEIVKASPNDIELLYDHAMLAEKAGDLATMERVLREIITSKPDFFHAYNALGYSFADRGENLQEARQLIEIALRLAPGDPFITDSLAWLNYREGKFSQSLALLEQAYSKRKDVEIAAHFGEVLWVSGDQARARVIWAEGLHLDASNATLQETLKRLGVSL